MRNRAFTLIELLVVIAIIAILASIALPAYRGVQERAHGVQDANNMRQLGVGFVGYLNDHDDTMFTGSTALSGSTSWANMLGPNGTGNYVQDLHVFQSPFDTRPYNGTSLSYGINSLVVNPVAVNGVTPTSVTSYTHSSALLILGPSCKANGSNLTFNGTITAAPSITPGSGVVGTMGSQQLMNILYADWHVASIKVADFNDNSSVPNGVERWNPVTTQ